MQRQIKSTSWALEIQHTIWKLKILFWVEGTFSDYIWSAVLLSSIADVTKYQKWR